VGLWAFIVLSSSFFCKSKTIQSIKKFLENKKRSQVAATSAKDNRRL
jgi:hypothetical protein